MKLENDFKIKCKKCNKEHFIGISDLGNPETASYERSMGYEIEHTWDYEFECDNCQNNIHISIQGYEYPENILNFENYNNGSGFIYITRPSLTIDCDE